MKLIECFLTKNDCYKAGTTMKIKGVMVHSTGANNPTIRRYVQPDVGGIGVNKNGNSWNRPGVNKCVHAFIGKLADGTVAAAQTLPWNRRGWHAGTGTKGSANDGYISFEVCEDSLTDITYFSTVYKEAVELTAMLCKKYGINPLADGAVICHTEGHSRGIASGHADINHWWPKCGKTMDDFRSDVAKEMGNEVKPTQTTQPAQTTTKVDADIKPFAAPCKNSAYNKTYTVNATAGLNLRAGWNTSAPIIKVLKNGEKVRCYGYYAVGNSGKPWLYVVAGGKVGYVSSLYLK